MAKDCSPMAHSSSSDYLLWVAIRQALIIIIRAIERRWNIPSCIASKNHRDRANTFLDDPETSSVKQG